MALTTSKIKTGNQSKLIIPAATGHVGTTAGWTNANDNSIVQCPASQTASTFLIPITGLNVGDTIMGAMLRGGTAGTTATKTLAWALQKSVGASGTITASNIQTLTADSGQTAHVLAIETYLTTPYKVAVNETYQILLTCTTAAADTYDISSIEIYVKETMGQTV